MPCPFFSTAIAPSSKPPSRAGSTRAVSRSRSKKPDPPSDSEELAASETPAATSRPVKPKLEGKGKRAVAAASTSRRVTRGASAAAQGATEPAAANEDEDDPMPAPKRTASRSVASKSKAVAKETAPEDPPVVRRMASRSKAKTKVVPTIEEQAEVEDERAPSPVVSGPSKSRPKPKRIPSQSKPKSAAPITVISDSEPDNSPGDTHMQDASSMHEPSGSLPQSDDMPPSSSRDDLPNSNSQSDHVAATAMPGIELTAAIEPQRSMQTPSPVPDSHGTPRQPLSPPTTLSGLPASLGSKIFSMPEAEQSMTVEEWIHHEIRLQHRKMEVDGRASIALFKQRALEVRQRIEAL
ncbi:hypothetical protein PLICRDRAFT_495167 [Plicaturopsis crispa FD-325 SS-3]|nr:hypothetical protein PLICRDRAFT_495167 [Plicaturopsis crispa FD-325 SS-3]